MAKKGTTPVAPLDVNDWPAHLKAIRDHYGLTQTEAAKRVGTVLRTWQNWEYGRSVPASAVQHLIATTFPMKSSS